MFKSKLNSILSTFDKTLFKLEKFIESNERDIDDYENQLAIKKNDQHRAINAKNNISKFLGE